MRKCFLMFVLWVIVLVFASVIKEPNEISNETMVVVLEVKGNADKVTHR